MSVTYYVAMPFVRNEEGELVAGEAQDRHRERRKLGLSMAETAASAIPLSQTIKKIQGCGCAAPFGDVPLSTICFGLGEAAPCRLIRVDRF